VKNSTKYHFYLLFLFWNSLIAVGQVDSNYQKMRSFVDNINSFNRLLPQEKVYLHFDNTSYFIGETIWFKAYVVNPEHNLPTGVSGVLYVDLLNQQGCVLQSRKLKIENGQCHGDFRLTDSLFSGFYEIRAYTRYMINFDQSSRWDCSTIFGNGMVYGSHWYKIRESRLDISKTIKEKQPLPDPLPVAYSESDMVFSRVFPVYERPSNEGGYEEHSIYPRSWTPTLFASDSRTSLGFYNYINIPKTHYPEVSSSLSISFYPEGGSLVRGLNSRVAFKVVDGSGVDVMVSGVVKDSANREVCTFSTQDRGMGVFYLTPEYTSGYTALIRYRDSLYRADLPSCISSGYVMSVNPISPDSSVFVRLESTLSDTGSILGLSIQSRGKVLWFDTIRVGCGRPTNLRIPYSFLSTGVNEITLFDASGQIYSDRLFFINKGDLGRAIISISPYSRVSNLKSFSAIQLDLNVTGENQQPLETSFSLSIRDLSTKEGSYNTDNIVTNLLLSSELKGFIPDPSYYISSTDRLHLNALELLMLTQGWRRYSWRKMAGVERFRMFEPAEKGLMLDGHVFEYVEKNPYSRNWFIPGKRLVSESGVNSFIGFNDSLVFSATTKTANDGSFVFHIPDFQGSHSGVLEFTAPPGRKKTYIIHLLSLLSKKYEEDFSYGLWCEINRIRLLPKSAYSYYETNLPFALVADSNVENRLPKESLNKGFNLRSVEVNAKRVHVRGYPDMSKPDIILTGEEALELYVDAGEIKGYASGHRVIGYERYPDNFWMFVKNIAGILNLSVKDIFYDDGEKICRINGLVDPRIENIESIGIYLSSTPRVPFNYCIGAYVLIKKGLASTRLDRQNTHRTRVEGYSYVSDFYHPDYSKGVPSGTMDFRRTLYWNPDVHTDSTGRVSVHFFNNASCRKLDISAEGITSDGVPFVNGKEFK
jgi:hypothetical protein